MHHLALRAFGTLPRFVRRRIVRLLYPTFTAGAAVVVEDPDGRVLLVTQSYTDDWSLPGGLMSRTETPDQTATRELFEEVGLDIDLSDRHPLGIRSTHRRHFTFVFHTPLPDTVPAADVRAHSPEITSTAWFDPHALPDLFDDTALYLEAVGLT